MLRRIWRPSATIRGTSPKSPRTSTRSATLLAIWVPLPWAMARRASFRAGTSLTPSPSIPTYSPSSASTRMTRCLPSGEIRPIAGAPRTAASSSASSSGRSRPSSAASPVMPTSWAIAPTVAGASPDTTFSATSSRWKKATVLSASGRRFSASTTIPSGIRSAGTGTSGPGSGRGEGVRPSASTRRPVAASVAAASCRSAMPSRPASSASGAPKTNRSVPSSSSALQRWREENGTCAVTGSAATSASAATCTASSVPLRRGRWRLPGQRADEIVVADPGGRRGLHDAQGGLGQRARLVGAQHAHRGERLDRVELLGQHAAAGDLGRRHGGGEAHEQDEPLGDEVDDRGGHRLHRVPGRVVAQRQRQAQGQRQGDHAADEDDQQPVHRLLQRRAGVAEGAGGGGEPGRLAVGAHRGGDEGALALDRVGAGEHGIARLLAHGLGLAGEVGLVDHDAGGLCEVAVGDDLVAGADAHEVADHDVLQRHGAGLTVADHHGGGGDEGGEAVERALGAHLLGDADAGVEEDDAEEERVLGVAQGEREGAEAHEDRVEHRERVGR